jgi:hypothetical protein
VEKVRSLTLGTKLVLVAGPLLLVSLFFNWQTAHIDYGPAGIAKVPQDGWDIWGLLLGVATIAAVTLVVLRRLTEVEMSDGVPWESLVLALAASAFALAALKNATDAYSTVESYGFVIVAGLQAVGAYLDWAAQRREHRAAAPGGTSRRVSSTA